MTRSQSAAARQGERSEGEISIITVVVLYMALIRPESKAPNPTASRTALPYLYEIDSDLEHVSFIVLRRPFGPSTDERT